MRRVVATGVGIVSPLGVGNGAVWNKLIQGCSGIARIESFEVGDMPVQIAGFTRENDGTLLNTENYVNPKDAKRMGRFIQLAMIAAREAVVDSGMNEASDAEKPRIGVIMGSGIGGIQGIEEATIALNERGYRRISPFFVPANLINLISGFISLEYGFQGPNSAVATACASGTHAIGDAYKMIQYGHADVMVCGGAEAPISPLGLAGFIAARALTANFNDNPTAASRPFDSLRDGFVMGEGAGVVVLEEYNHAVARGAKIYGEIIGYGLSGDAHHITAPPEDGNGGFRAMQMAVKSANINPADIDYINAHGTSTPLGDEIELRAINQLMAGHSAGLCVSSTKSAIGHLLGAAGAVEAIFCLNALQNGILPPTLNLQNPCEHFGMNLIPQVAIERPINIALSNSFGFGGTNASIIMRKC